MYTMICRMWGEIERWILLSGWRISAGKPADEKNVFRMGPVFTVNFANHIIREIYLLKSSLWFDIKPRKIIQ